MFWVHHGRVSGMKTKRLALYARVSTDAQTTENQLRQLRIVAERNGWTIIAEYVDQGISGAKGRDQRPQFDALCKAVRSNQDFARSNILFMEIIFLSVSYTTS